MSSLLAYLPHLLYSTALTSVSMHHLAQRKAAEAVHKAEKETQSWGQWFGSWFGYGKAKTEQTYEETKREAAATVAENARKVETEANKRA